MGILPRATEPGVYCITNTVTHKVYIGSSVCPERRQSEHFKKLRLGAHANPHLQSAYNEYSENCFTFRVLETVSKGDLLVREQYWMDHFRAYDRNYGYNICPCANRTAHSEETKLRLSKLVIERCKSTVFRMKMRATAKRLGLHPPSRKGTTLTPEHRAKISASLRVRVVTESTRQKIRENMKRIWKQRQLGAAC